MYPLLICLPAYVFFCGAAMLFQSVTRNRPLTFTALIGLMALFLVLASGRAYYTFDAFAFGLPVLLSEYTGLARPVLTAVQRISFMAMGLAMAPVAFLLIPRPRQSKTARLILSAAVPALAAVSVICSAGYFMEHRAGEALRAGMMAEAEGLRDEPLATPVTFDIDVIHNGGTLDIRTGIVLRNDTGAPLGKLIFNLNPGLEVSSVMSGGRNLGFERRYQVIEVSLPEALQPGALDTLTISCSGRIDDRACFPDADEKIRWKGFSQVDDSNLYDNPAFSSVRFGHSRFRFRRSFSFVTEELVLLLPYSMWYPSPGLVRGSGDPGLEHWFFADHRLSVHTGTGLKAVTQGRRIEESPGEFRFIPDDPLPGITLAVGRFTERSTEVDSVTYSLSTLCADDYFMPFFESAADTIPAVIGDLREYIDSHIGLEYPFRSFSIVETPVNLYCFARTLVTNGSGYSPPGLVMAPERAYKWYDSYIYRLHSKSWQKFYFDMDMEEGPKGGIVRTFFSSMRGSLMDVGNNLLSSYYSGVIHIGSGSRSAVDHAVDSHLGSRIDYFLDIDNKYSPGTNALARAIVDLDGNNLPGLLSGTQGRREALEVLPVKGKQLIIELQGLAGEEEVDRFFRDLISANRGRVITEDEFISSFEAATGQEIRPVVDRWYNCRELPGFIIEDVEWYVVDDEETEKYQFRFKAHNLEQCHGMVRVIFSFQSKMGKAIRDGTAGEKFVKTFLFGPGESKDIGVVTVAEPRTVYINTVISKNLPAVREYRTRGFEGRKHLQPLDGERVIGTPPPGDGPGVIIVDNVDPGFEVLAEPEIPLLKRVLGLARREDDGWRFRKFLPKNPPAVWRETVLELCYGRYVKSGHFVAAGAGTGRVRWTVDIPESGTYEVYHHMVDYYYSMKPKFRKNTSVQEYHFSITHDEGADERVLVLYECPLGWNLLGTYYFSKGKATVELTDESPKWFIIADAVKWVKKD